MTYDVRRTNGDWKVIFKDGERYDEYYDIYELCDILNKQLNTIISLQASVKILQSEIDSAQQICEMLSEKLKGYGENV